jgi:hypothetical protein
VQGALHLVDSLINFLLNLADTFFDLTGLTMRYAPGLQAFVPGQAPTASFAWPFI